MFNCQTKRKHMFFLYFDINYYFETDTTLSVKYRGL